RPAGRKARPRVAQVHETDAQLLLPRKHAQKRRRLALGDPDTLRQIFGTHRPIAAKALDYRLLGLRPPIDHGLPPPLCPSAPRSAPTPPPSCAPPRYPAVK